MALNFRPYPFREDQYSGKDTAETISSGLKSLGDTFSEYGEQKRMRERHEMDRQRLEDDRRLQTLKLAMDEGLDPSVIDEYLNNPNAGRAPKRILSPMQNPRPILSSNRLNLPADFQSSPDVPSFPMGTKRIQAQEDRELSRRKTEAEIQKLGSSGVNYQAKEYLDSKGRSRIGRFNPQLGIIEKSDQDAYAPQTARGETAGNLRKEFIDRPETKDFQAINTQVRSMDSLLNRAMAGDLQGRNFLDQSLITIFNKINDPTSVVRESEYARTPEGLALANRLSGAVEKIANGGAGLTDQDRIDLVSAAKIIANARGGTYARTREGYVNLANQMTLDPSLITATMPEFSPYEVGGKVNNRMSKQQRHKTTGETITVYSDDGGQTWHP